MGAPKPSDGYSSSAAAAEEDEEEAPARTVRVVWSDRAEAEAEASDARVAAARRSAMLSEGVATMTDAMWGEKRSST
jgi:hypothetical protein